jgi:hypothetical protein
MARTTYVGKARKHYTCEKCGTPITPGDPYKHITPRSNPSVPGVTRRRCAQCPAWRINEVSSSRMAPIYEAQASFSASFESADDVVAALATVVETVREVAEQYRESSQNMADGFGHTTIQSDELGAKAGNLEAWADEIAAVTVPDQSDYPVTCDECDGTGGCQWCDGDGCESCDETGRCSACNGEGHISGDTDMEMWRAEVENVCSVVALCPV